MIIMFDVQLSQSLRNRTKIDLTTVSHVFYYFALLSLDIKTGDGAHCNQPSCTAPDDKNSFLALLLGRPAAVGTLLISLPKKCIEL